MRRYLRRVVRAAFGFHELDGARATVNCRKEPGRVILVLEHPNLEMELPLSLQTAWLLGGRMMDLATEAAAEQDEAG
jgi:hypothetical protein